jgi:hypothetical protein
MLWQIRHFLNEVSPLATSCAIPAPVDVAISAAATISVLVIVIMRPFPFGVGPALGDVGHALLGRKFGPQAFKTRQRSVSTANWPHRRSPIGRASGNSSCQLIFDCCSRRDSSRREDGKNLGVMFFFDLFIEVAFIFPKAEDIEGQSAAGSQAPQSDIVERTAADQTRSIMQIPTVLVCGAGIAGPTLAYWLKCSGFAPTVLERAPTLRSSGYVIDFWGLGYDIAEKMGLLPQILNQGYHVKELRVLDGHGKRVSRHQGI